MVWLALWVVWAASGAAGLEETLTVAAGCFWSIELVYQRIPGVVRTEVGYIGGNQPNPSYRDVTTGTTGHTEGVRIWFDSGVVSTEDLLRVFWDIHDPFDARCQGNDCGSQYRSSIFYNTEDQGAVVAASAAALGEGRGKKVATVMAAEEYHRWWQAEDYHQQYLEKGGQDAQKGSTAPVQCYGAGGPIKKVAELAAYTSVVASAAAKQHGAAAKAREGPADGKAAVKDVEGTAASQAEELRAAKEKQEQTLAKARNAILTEKQQETIAKAKMAKHRAGAQQQADGRQRQKAAAAAVAAARRRMEEAAAGHQGRRHQDL